MINWTLINQTVELINRTEEAEGITEQDSLIQDKVLDWYNHTDITDVDVLAAAALHGYYDPDITYSQLVQEVEELF